MWTENNHVMDFVTSLEIKPVKLLLYLETKDSFWILS